MALSVLGDRDRYAEPLALAAVAREEEGKRISTTLALELDRLGDAGLVGVNVEGKGPYQAGQVYGSQGPPSRWPPASLALLPAGQQLFDAMRLGEISDDSKRTWLAALAEN